MRLLLYLFTVATDKDGQVNGGFRRTPAVAWIYGQAFLAIVTGSPAVLRFKDCDAWVESPGVPQGRTGFQGDTAELAERLVLGDTDLAFVLHRDPKAGAHAYRVSEADVNHVDLERLRAALGSVPSALLLDPANAEHVRETLHAWSLDAAPAQPVPEIEIGSHRPGGRGTTITV